MADFIEIKAMNQEEAKQRAIRVLDLDDNQILNIIEKNKSKSFFGLFNKDGLYKIEYTTEKIVLKQETTNLQELSVNKKIKKPKTEIKKSLKKDDKDEEKLNRIFKLSKEILNNMNLNLKVDFLEFKDKVYYINLSGEDQGIIIGKKGKTLNSFEYLLNSLLKDLRVSVDVQGFKEKRNKTLKELANKMALKAIKTKRVVRLNPMPPRERKIIHEIINQYKELDTFSEGRDPKRYIVIKRKK
ncbi:MAG: R3H domain-containing nucleic acid-binding protein [Fusobacterium sp. JB021]|nr:R3H domain-containing nucleic acid-binding protein [Fusobacterium sp. JB020]MDP0493654.1 R3H domain-containing nucleic acid-binding protein [Fusobacterium sp. JB021]MDP0507178.1 R3H domain-containing nucleic acid-binding protein [Fusobacterium sp. JB019]